MLILILLVIDLVAHRDDHATSRKSAIIWSIIWIASGLAFNVFVYNMFGGRAGQQYLAAYLIEKSLSLDNLFVFLIVFRGLNTPEKHQHRVLFWGIFGALVFRGLFIFAGAVAIERWQWVSYIFGALLLYGAYSALRKDPARERKSEVVEWLSNHLPVTEKVQDTKFFSIENGKHVATPLFVALVAIELTDIAFAIDSVPAAFSMSHSRFILYSSNVFAILGLRALYITLAHSLARLKYLRYGLAGVLAFAGFKLIADQWIEIHTLVSVGVIVLMIGLSVWASLGEKKM